MQRTPKPSMEQAFLLCGTHHSRRRAGPCPGCGSTAHRSDGRPPVHFGRDSWRCVACKRYGDGFGFVGLFLQLGEPMSRADFKVMVGFVESGEVQKRAPRPEDDEELERIDPWPALLRAVPLQQAKDRRLHAWLASRALPVTAPAGYLRGFRAPWWPYRDLYPVIVPACTGRGVVESMHGRSIEDGKTIWPKGAASRELLFATPPTRAWMCGSAPPPSDIVIVEGLTDYLTWSSTQPQPAIGVYAGAAAALATTPFTRRTKVWIGTDDDAVGDKYAEEVADVLSGTAVVRRMPMRQVNEWRGAA